MDPVSLGVLLATTKIACFSAAAVVMDDIAVLAATVMGITKHTKDDIARNGRIENRALSIIMGKMIMNRLVVGLGLAASFALAICFAPALMPFISGVLGVGAGGFFAYKCVEEGHEMIERFHADMKARKPLTRITNKILHKLRPHTVKIPPHMPKKLVVETEKEAELSDDHIVQRKVKKATSKDRGLTIELMLVAIATALAYPDFSSLVSRAAGGLPETIGFFAVPLLGAGIATMGIVWIGILMLTKTDNLGHWFEKECGQEKVGKSLGLFGKGLVLLIGPMGAILLTGIAGNMFAEGLEKLAPAAAELLPHIATSWIAQVATGVCVGITVVCLLKPAKGIRALVFGTKENASLKATKVKVAVTQKK